MIYTPPHLGRTIVYDICWRVQLLLLSMVPIKVRNNRSIAVSVKDLSAEGVEPQTVPCTARLKKWLSN